MKNKKINSGSISIAFSGDWETIQTIAQKFVGKANISVSADYETNYFGGHAVRLGGHTGSADINIATISAEAVEKIIQILFDEVGAKTNA